MKDSRGMHMALPLARTKDVAKGPAMNRADRPCVCSFFLNKLIFASLALIYMKSESTVGSIGPVGEKKCFFGVFHSYLMINNRTVLGYLHCLKLSCWSCRTPVTEGGKIMSIW